MPETFRHSLRVSQAGRARSFPERRAVAALTALAVLLSTSGTSALADSTAHSLRPDLYQGLFSDRDDNGTAATANPLGLDLVARATGVASEQIQAILPSIRDRLQGHVPQAFQDQQQIVIAGVAASLVNAEAGQRYLLDQVTGAGGAKLSVQQVEALTTAAREGAPLNAGEDSAGTVATAGRRPKLVLKDVEKAVERLERRRGDPLMGWLAGMVATERLLDVMRPEVRGRLPQEQQVRLLRVIGRHGAALQRLWGAHAGQGGVLDESVREVVRRAQRSGGPEVQRLMRPAGAPAAVWRSNRALKAHLQSGVRESESVVFMGLGYEIQQEEAARQRAAAREIPEIDLERRERVDAAIIELQWLETLRAAGEQQGPMRRAAQALLADEGDPLGQSVARLVIQRLGWAGEGTVATAEVPSPEEVARALKRMRAASLKELVRVPGIGHKRAAHLRDALQGFGVWHRRAVTTLKDLEHVRGIGRLLARRLVWYFAQEPVPPTPAVAEAVVDLQAGEETRAFVNVQKATAEDIHLATGLDRGRARRIVRALEDFQTRNTRPISTRQELLAYKGIGRWTVDRLVAAFAEPRGHGKPPEAGPGPASGTVATASRPRERAVRQVVEGLSGSLEQRIAATELAREWFDEFDPLTSRAIQRQLEPLIEGLSANLNHDDARVARRAQAVVSRLALEVSVLHSSASVGLPEPTGIFRLLSAVSPGAFQHRRWRRTAQQAEQMMERADVLGRTLQALRHADRDVVWQARQTVAALSGAPGFERQLIDRQGEMVQLLSSESSNLREVGQTVLADLAEPLGWEREPSAFRDALGRFLPQLLQRFAQQERFGRHLSAALLGDLWRAQEVGQGRDPQEVEQELEREVLPILRLGERFIFYPPDPAHPFEQDIQIAIARGEFHRALEDLIEAARADATAPSGLSKAVQAEARRAAMRMVDAIDVLGEAGGPRALQVLEEVRTRMEHPPLVVGRGQPVPYPVVVRAVHQAIEATQVVAQASRRLAEASAGLPTEAQRRLAEATIGELGQALADLKLTPRTREGYLFRLRGYSGLVAKSVDEALAAKALERGGLDRPGEGTVATATAEQIHQWITTLESPGTTRDAKIGAIEALGHAFAREAVPALGRVLQAALPVLASVDLGDPEREMGIAATLALAEIGGPQAVVELVAAYQGLPDGLWRDDSRDDLDRDIADTLRLLPEPERRAVLAQFVSEQHPYFMGEGETSLKDLTAAQQLAVVLAIYAPPLERDEGHAPINVEDARSIRQWVGEQWRARRVGQDPTRLNDILAEIRDLVFPVVRLAGRLEIDRSGGVFGRIRLATPSQLTAQVIDQVQHLRDYHGALQTLTAAMYGASEADALTAIALLEWTGGPAAWQALEAASSNPAIQRQPTLAAALSKALGSTTPRAGPGDATVATAGLPAPTWFAIGSVLRGLSGTPDERVAGAQRLAAWFEDPAASGAFLLRWRAGRIVGALVDNLRHPDGVVAAHAQQAVRALVSPWPTRRVRSEDWQRARRPFYQALANSPVVERTFANLERELPTVAPLEDPVPGTLAGLAEDARFEPQLIAHQARLMQWLAPEVSPALRGWASFLLRGLAEPDRARGEQVSEFRRALAQRLPELLQRYTTQPRGVFGPDLDARFVGDLWRLREDAAGRPSADVAQDLDRSVLPLLRLGERFVEHPPQLDRERDLQIAIARGEFRQGMDALAEAARRAVPPLPPRADRAALADARRVAVEVSTAIELLGEAGGSTAREVIDDLRRTVGPLSSVVGGHPSRLVIHAVEQAAEAERVLERAAMQVAELDRTGVFDGAAHTRLDDDVGAELAQLRLTPGQRRGYLLRLAVLPRAGISNAMQRALEKRSRRERGGLDRPGEGTVATAVLDPGTVREVMSGLASDDLSKQADAARQVYQWLVEHRGEALGQGRSQAALVSGLLGVLRTPDATGLGRSLAVQSLIVLGRESGFQGALRESFPALHRLLADGSPDLREAVLMVVGGYGEQPALHEALGASGLARAALAELRYNDPDVNQWARIFVRRAAQRMATPLVRAQRFHTLVLREGVIEASVRNLTYGEDAVLSVLAHRTLTAAAPQAGFHTALARARAVPEAVPLLLEGSHEERRAPRDFLVTLTGARPTVPELRAALQSVPQQIVQHLSRQRPSVERTEQALRVLAVLSAVYPETTARHVASVPAAYQARWQHHQKQAGRWVSDGTVATAAADPKAVRRALDDLRGDLVALEQARKTWDSGAILDIFALDMRPHQTALVQLQAAGIADPALRAQVAELWGAYGGVAQRVRDSAEVLSGAHQGPGAPDALHEALLEVLDGMDRLVVSSLLRPFAGEGAGTEDQRVALAQLRQLGAPARAVLTQLAAHSDEVVQATARRALAQLGPAAEPEPRPSAEQGEPPSGGEQREGTVATAAGLPGVVAEQAAEVRRVQEWVATYEAESTVGREAVESARREVAIVLEYLEGSQRPPRVVAGVNVEAVERAAARLGEAEAALREVSAERDLMGRVAGELAGSRERLIPLAADLKSPDPAAAGGPAVAAVQRVRDEVARALDQLRAARVRAEQAGGAVGLGPEGVRAYQALRRAVETLTFATHPAGVTIVEGMYVLYLELAEEGLGMAADHLREAGANDLADQLATAGQALALARARASTATLAQLGPAAEPEPRPSAEQGEPPSGGEQREGTVATAGAMATGGAGGVERLLARFEQGDVPLQALRPHVLAFLRVHRDAPSGSPILGRVQHALAVVYNDVSARQNHRDPELISMLRAAGVVAQFGETYPSQLFNIVTSDLRWLYVIDVGFADDLEHIRGMAKSFGDASLDFRARWRALQRLLQPGVRPDYRPEVATVAMQLLAAFIEVADAALARVTAVAPPTASADVVEQGDEKVFQERVAGMIDERDASVWLLADLAGDPHPVVRAAAWNVLREIRETAGPVLTQTVLSGDQDRRVRVQAAVSLGHLGWSRGEALAAVEELQRSVSAEASAGAPGVGHALRHVSRARDQIARALKKAQSSSSTAPAAGPGDATVATAQAGEPPDELAIRPVVQALTEGAEVVLTPDSQVLLARWATGEVFQRWDRNRLAAMQTALTEELNAVVIPMLRIAQHLARAEALDPVAQLVDRPVSELVARGGVLTAFESLTSGLTAGPGARESTAEAAIRQQVALHAALRLAQMGSPAAVRALRERAAVPQDPGDQIGARVGALIATVRRIMTPVGRLTRATDARERRAVIQLLGREFAAAFPEAEVQPFIEQLPAGYQIAVADAASRARAGVPWEEPSSEAVLDAAGALVTGVTQREKLAAADALGRLGGVGAFNELLAAAFNPGVEPDPDVRARVEERLREAVVTLPPEERTQAFERLAQHLVTQLRAASGPRAAGEEEGPAWGDVTWAGFEAPIAGPEDLENLLYQLAPQLVPSPERVALRAAVERLIYGLSPSERRELFAARARVLASAPSPEEAGPAPDVSIAVGEFSFDPELRPFPRPLAWLASAWLSRQIHEGRNVVMLRTHVRHHLLPGLRVVNHLVDFGHPIPQVRARSQWGRNIVMMALAGGVDQVIAVLAHPLSVHEITESSEARAIREAVRLLGVAGGPVAQDVLAVFERRLETAPPEQVAPRFQPNLLRLVQKAKARAERETGSGTVATASTDAPDRHSVQHVVDGLRSSDPARQAEALAQVRRWFLEGYQDTFVWFDVDRDVMRGLMRGLASPIEAANQASLFGLLFVIRVPSFRGALREALPEFSHLLGRGQPQVQTVVLQLVGAMGWEPDLQADLERLGLARAAVRRLGDVGEGILPESRHAVLRLAQQATTPLMRAERFYGMLHQEHVVSFSARNTHSDDFLLPTVAYETLQAAAPHVVFHAQIADSGIVSESVGELFGAHREAAAEFLIALARAPLLGSAQLRHAVAHGVPREIVARLRSRSPSLRVAGPALSVLGAIFDGFPEAAREVASQVPGGYQEALRAARSRAESESGTVATAGRAGDPVELRRAVRRVQQRVRRFERLFEDVAAEVDAVQLSRGPVVPGQFADELTDVYQGELRWVTWLLLGDGRTRLLQDMDLVASDWALLDTRARTGYLGTLVRFVKAVTRFLDVAELVDELEPDAAELEGAVRQLRTAAAYGIVSTFADPDEVEAVQEAAIRGFNHLGAVGREDLVGLLGDERPVIRMATGMVLRELGAAAYDDDVLRALDAAIARPGEQEDVRKMLERALEAIETGHEVAQEDIRLMGGDASVATARAAGDEAEPLAGPVDDGRVVALAAQLAAGSFRARIEAAQALGRLKGWAVEQALVERLSQERDSAVRAAMAEALLSVVRASSFLVREDAGVTARELVRDQHLADPNPHVRGAVSAVLGELGQLGDPGGQLALVTMVVQEEEVPWVRLVAADALGRALAPYSPEELEQALTDLRAPLRVEVIVRDAARGSRPVLVRQPASTDRLIAELSARVQALLDVEEAVRAVGADWATVVLREVESRERGAVWDLARSAAPRSGFAFADQLVSRIDAARGRLARGEARSAVGETDLLQTIEDLRGVPGEGTVATAAMIGREAAGPMLVNRRIFRDAKSLRPSQQHVPELTVQPRLVPRSADVAEVDEEAMLALVLDPRPGTRTIITETPTQAEYAGLSLIVQLMELADREFAMGLATGGTHETMRKALGLVGLVRDVLGSYEGFGKATWWSTLDNYAFSTNTADGVMGLSSYPWEQRNYLLDNLYGPGIEQRFIAPGDRRYTSAREVVEDGQRFRQRMRLFLEETHRILVQLHGVGSDGHDAFNEIFRRITRLRGTYVTPIRGMLEIPPARQLDLKSWARMGLLRPDHGGPTLDITRVQNFFHFGKGFHPFFLRFMADQRIFDMDELIDTLSQMPIEELAAYYPERKYQFQSEEAFYEALQYVLSHYQTTPAWAITQGTADLVKRTYNRDSVNLLMAWGSHKAVPLLGIYGDQVTLARGDQVVPVAEAPQGVPSAWNTASSLVGAPNLTIVASQEAARLLERTHPGEFFYFSPQNPHWVRLKAEHVERVWEQSPGGQRVAAERRKLAALGDGTMATAGLGSDGVRALVGRVRTTAGQLATALERGDTARARELMTWLIEEDGVSTVQRLNRAWGTADRALREELLRMWAAVAAVLVQFPALPHDEVGPDLRQSAAVVQRRVAGLRGMALLQVARPLTANDGQDPLERVAREEFQELGDAGVKALAALLRHQEPSVRERVALALGRLGKAAAAVQEELGATLRVESVGQVQNALQFALLAIHRDVSRGEPSTGEGTAATAVGAGSRPEDIWAANPRVREQVADASRGLRFELPPDAQVWAVRWFTDQFAAGRSVTDVRQAFHRTVQPMLRAGTAILEFHRDAPPGSWSTPAGQVDASVLSFVEEGEPELAFDGLLGVVSFAGLPDLPGPDTPGGGALEAVRREQALRAVQLLRAAGGPESLQALQHFSDHPDPEVRSLADAAVRDLRALREAVDRMPTMSAEIRGMALGSLGNLLRGEAPRELLLQIPPELRGRAMVARSRRPMEQGTEDLAEAMANLGSPELKLRGQAQEQVARLGGLAGFRALLPLLDPAVESDERLRAGVPDALAFSFLSLLPEERPEALTALVDWYRAFERGRRRRHVGEVHRALAAFLEILPAFEREQILRVAVPTMRIVETQGLDSEQQLLVAELLFDPDVRTTSPTLPLLVLAWFTRHMLSDGWTLEMARRTLRANVLPGLRLLEAFAQEAPDRMPAPTPTPRVGEAARRLLQAGRFEEAFTTLTQALFSEVRPDEAGPAAAGFTLAEIREAAYLLGRAGGPAAVAALSALLPTAGPELDLRIATTLGWALATVPSDERERVQDRVSAPALRVQVFFALRQVDPEETGDEDGTVATAGAEAVLGVFNQVLKRPFSTPLDREGLHALKDRFDQLPPHQQLAFTHSVLRTLAGAAPELGGPRPPRQVLARPQFVSVDWATTYDLSLYTEPGPGDTLRIAKVDQMMGSSGPNAARVLASLGAPVQFFGLAGQFEEGLLATATQRLGKADFLRGKTRTVLLIQVPSKSGGYTELRFVPRPPRVPARDAQRLVQHVLSRLPRAEGLAFAVVAAQGLRGGPPEVYAHMIRGLKGKGYRVVVDPKVTLRPEEWAAVLSASPDLLKPNLKEFASHDGLTREALNGQIGEIASRSRRLAERHGITAVIVSLEGDGAIVAHRDEHGNYPVDRVPAPDVDVRGRLGAGDALIAGLVWKLAQDEKLLDALIFGVAAGSAWATRPLIEGVQDKQEIDALVARMMAHPGGPVVHLLPVGTVATAAVPTGDAAGVPAPGDQIAALTAQLAGKSDRLQERVDLGRRMAAARDLGTRNEPVVTAVFLDRLVLEPAPQVRAEIAEQLVRVLDRQGSETARLWAAPDRLAPFLEDEEPAVRGAIADVLSRLADARATEALLAALKAEVGREARGEDVLWVKLALAKALGRSLQRSPDRVEGIVLQVQADLQRDVREAARGWPIVVERPESTEAYRRMLNQELNRIVYLMRALRGAGEGRERLVLEQRLREGKDRVGQWVRYARPDQQEPAVREIVRALDDVEPQVVSARVPPGDLPAVQRIYNAMWKLVLLPDLGAQERVGATWELGHGTAATAARGGLSLEAMDGTAATAAGPGEAGLLRRVREAQETIVEELIGAAGDVVVARMQQVGEGPTDRGVRALMRLIDARDLLSEAVHARAPEAAALRRAAEQAAVRLEDVERDWYALRRAGGGPSAEPSGSSVPPVSDAMLTRLAAVRQELRDISASGSGGEGSVATARARRAEEGPSRGSQEASTRLERVRRVLAGELSEAAWVALNGAPEKSQEETNAAKVIADLAEARTHLASVLDERSRDEETLRGAARYAHFWLSEAYKLWTQETTALLVDPATITRLAAVIRVVRDVGGLGPKPGSHLKDGQATAEPPSEGDVGALGEGTAATAVRESVSLQVLPRGPRGGAGAITGASGDRDAGREGSRSSDALSVVAAAPGWPVWDPWVGFAPRPSAVVGSRASVVLLNAVNFQALGTLAALESYRALQAAAGPEGQGVKVALNVPWAESPEEAAAWVQELVTAYTRLVPESALTPAAFDVTIGGEDPAAVVEAVRRALGVAPTVVVGPAAWVSRFKTRSLLPGVIEVVLNPALNRETSASGATAFFGAVALAVQGDVPPDVAEALRQLRREGPQRMAVDPLQVQDDFKERQQWLAWFEEWV